MNFISSRLTCLLSRTDNLNLCQSNTSLRFNQELQFLCCFPSDFSVNIYFGTKVVRIRISFNTVNLRDSSCSIVQNAKLQINLLRCPWTWRTLSIDFALRWRPGVPFEDFRDFGYYKDWPAIQSSKSSTFIQHYVRKKNYFNFIIVVQKCRSDKSLCWKQTEANSWPSRSQSLAIWPANMDNVC